jgi:hypothetical protein
MCEFFWAKLGPLMFANNRSTTGKKRKALMYRGPEGPYPYSIDYRVGRKVSSLES